MPLDMQGVLVDGEAPAHLLTWLIAIDNAHNQVMAEGSPNA